MFDRLNKDARMKREVSSRAADSFSQISSISKLGPRNTFHSPPPMNKNLRMDSREDLPSPHFNESLKSLDK